MKKIYTLLTATLIGSVAFGQTVFQSDLSSWASGDPTDWMGNTTNFASARVVEQTTGATYGTSFASLVNTSTTHNRFTTQPTTVVGGETYLIEIWMACQNSGEIRTNYYDATNASYGTYNPYIDAAAASAGNLVMISQTVTVPATCTSAEFILSVRNTDVTLATVDIGILVDSVAITATTPPAPNNTKIYDIQYTTAPSGDSPELGNVVTTKGVITGIVKNGPARHSFFLQDSALAWNGIFVFQTNDSSLVIGDSVEVTGTVAEYFDNTQIEFVSNINVLNSGNALPAAITNSTLNCNMEEWEGVLINVSNAQCTNNTEGFGLWSLDDGSGVIKADDDIFPYHLTALVGTNYNVTGIGHYSFSEFKILPRDVNDISVVTSIEEYATEKVIAYPNPVVNVINFNLSVNTASIQIMDVTGRTLKTVNTNSNTVSMTLNGLSNGVYFYTVVSEGKTVASDRFVVAK